MGHDKLEKSLPRVPTPKHCNECNNSINSDWSESDSVPVSNNDNDNYIQKQLSLLENYERNHSRTCSVSHEKKCKRRNEDLDDIANFLDDNTNQINIKLQKYVVVEKSDIEVMSKKSRSLPRNYETSNGYYHGQSNSLPRTSDSGKDFIRDMKRYGSYRPKSKSDASNKKHGFIDKIKNIFVKKSQVHLTENNDTNNTWLYKDKNVCSKNCQNEKIKGCNVHNYDDISLSR